jgi:hypothetical protein
MKKKKGEKKEQEDMNVKEEGDTKGVSKRVTGSAAAGRADGGRAGCTEETDAKGASGIAAGGAAAGAAASGRAGLKEENGAKGASESGGGNESDSGGSGGGGGNRGGDRGGDGVDRGGGNSGLLDICKSKEAPNMEKVLAFIAGGIDDPYLRDEFGRTCLVAASQMGHLSIVLALLGVDSSPRHVRVCGTYGNSLTLAIEGHHLGIVRALLEVDAEQTNLLVFGWTGLCRASAAGHSDIVRALLEVDPSTEHIRMMNLNGMTALILASMTCSTNVVRALLEVDPSAEHVNMPVGGSFGGWTALNFARNDEIKALLLAAVPQMELPAEVAMELIDEVLDDASECDTR